jgi:hypothetical protein
MALTNKEILMQEMMLHNIDLETKIDTYAGWNRNGYTINKGSKALFTTKIWKPCKSKNKETEQVNNKMYLVKASFFSQDQVTKIEQKQKVS